MIALFWCFNVFKAIFNIYDNELSTFIDLKPVVVLLLSPDTLSKNRSRFRGPNKFSVKNRSALVAVAPKTRWMDENEVRTSSGHTGSRCFCRFSSHASEYEERNGAVGIIMVAFLLSCYYVSVREPSKILRKKKEARSVQRVVFAPCRERRRELLVVQWRFVKKLLIVHYTYINWGGSNRSQNTKWRKTSLATSVHRIYS